MLWNDDTDIPPTKRGIRFYRTTPLGSPARDILDTLDYEDFKEADAIGKIVALFDSHYKSYIEAKDEDSFELAIYGSKRPPSQKFVDYCSARQAAFKEQEKRARYLLPDSMKTQILLKYANLNKEQTNAVMIWTCLLYTSPSPRDLSTSRMPSSA